MLHLLDLCDTSRLYYITVEHCFATRFRAVLMLWQISLRANNELGSHWSTQNKKDLSLKWQSIYTAMQHINCMCCLVPQQPRFLQAVQLICIFFWFHCQCRLHPEIINCIQLIPFRRLLLGAPTRSLWRHWALREGLDLKLWLVHRIIISQCYYDVTLLL